MQDFVGAHQAGVPEGAMDQLGHSESPFLKSRRIHFHQMTGISHFILLPLHLFIFSGRVQRSDSFGLLPSKKRRSEGLRVRDSDRKGIFDEIITLKTDYYATREKGNMFYLMTGHTYTQSCYLLN